MRESKNGDFLFYVAGGLLVLAFVLGWFVSTPSALEMLHYIGWIIWAVGIVSSRAHSPPPIGVLAPRLL